MFVRVNFLALAACLAIAAPGALAQSSIDLNTWTAEDYDISTEPAGVWTVASGGGSVFQSVNGDPTIFYSDFTAFGATLSGQITVNTTTDDDFIGFVIGWQPGFATNTAAEYLLVDWKQGTQTTNFGGDCTGSSNAPAGLAVSRVNGIPTSDEFWGHDDQDAMPCSPLGQGLTELARGTNLGATGWADNQTYTFAFEYTSTLLRVFVDGVLEIEITGTFADGRLGFYNFSQTNVTYNAFTLFCNQAAMAVGYGPGSAGSAGFSTLSLSAAPVLGSTVNLIGTNGSGFHSTGCLISGDTAANDTFAPLTFPFLVDINSSNFSVLDTAVPATDLILPVAIPADPGLCGEVIYLQLIQWDAPMGGYLGSNGVEVTLGD